MILRHLGRCHYQPVWERMRDFTARRDGATEDEIWLLQHHPVFTRGCGCHAEPTALEAAQAEGGDSGAAAIPLVHSDRGGRMTYHGPGQLVVYLLLDLKRLGVGPKALVHGMEQAVIEVLADDGILGERRRGAPGVYVGGAKIAALGVRIRAGCCYHGLSINVDMDLTPYRRIDPCGYPHLAVTQLAAHLPAVDVADVEGRLVRRLKERFDGNNVAPPPAAAVSPHPSIAHDTPRPPPPPPPPRAV